jgi:phage tail sheath protein FI
MQALIGMVQDRGDCMAIIDPPFGLTVREIIQWSNGVHPLNSYPLNTDFAALYWPWLSITDIDNSIDVWVPPSGSVAGAYARSDNLAFPWYAPAGLERGLLTAVNDVYNRPTLAERDSMYGNGNAINPIVSFADSFGFVIFGQKTLQRRPTALDRVNVRRMLFYIEKQIKTQSRRLLFEPNDDTTRQNFIDLAKGVLDSVTVNRGITDYNIQCDTVLNTPDVIDRNELRAKIGVIPTKAVEFIFIEFTILRTGALS